MDIDMDISLYNGHWLPFFNYHMVKMVFKDDATAYDVIASSDMQTILNFFEIH
jgi:hypothetical protein